MSRRAATAPATSGLSRRGVIAGAAATAAAAATVTLTAGEAEASAKLYLPKTRSYSATHIPTVATRHMASRFAYGYTPKLGREITAAGGPVPWFTKQLDPDSISDATADGFDTWFETRNTAPVDSYAKAIHGSGWIADAMAGNGRWSMLRRAYSNRHVLEVMTEFWENHLHIYADADMQWLWRTDYDRLIRSHALGRFDEMLQDAIVHPSMLTYLDGDLSMIDRSKTPEGASELNENLGRELLELHTVGRTAGYTEAQVTDSARILTGYYIDRFKTWEYSYEPDRHYTGEVTVMDFTRANTSRDGREVLQAYLQYLAHHPATAQRIARKLAVRFVSDDPSTGLVNELADVFTSSGTDITATLKALVAHPEFEQSVGMKIRTPTEDLIQTIRAFGVKISKPTSDADAANSLYNVSKGAGQVPFGWGPPDGFPDNGPIWSSASRLMGSYHIHYTFAGGFYPRSGITYRPHASWLPEKQLRFDEFVDHLCRELHGQRSTRLLLGAACIAVDQQPGDQVDADHVLVKYRMAKLLGILLDTPQHMTR
jgi:uncharacterized protein (DUF1800 family)